GDDRLHGPCARNPAERRGGSQARPARRQELPARCAIQSPRMSLVVLDDVTLFFGDRMIFDAVSLRLGHGDRVGLIGPNGSGKTTLLKVIAGEQEVDDGNITRANGVRVGWLPQEIAIAGGRSLIDMILSSVPGRAEL